jgi:hypothetical protein
MYTKVLWRKKRGEEEDEKKRLCGPVTEKYDATSFKDK